MSEVEIKIENKDPDSVVTSVKSEEYAYLDKGGFSSENYKIELRGLPKYYGIAELKKLMNTKLNLNVSKIKRPRTGSHWLYACFQNEEARKKAIVTLNGYSWKGKVLQAEEAEPAPDPLVRKRKQDDKGGDAKIAKLNDGRSQEERLKDATTPFWNVPYEEQLTNKENHIRSLLMKVDNDIWKLSKDRKADISEKRKLFNGLTLDLQPIERSPITEGYRNKCEFTLGVDEETELTTVGFRLGSYVTGTVAVAPIQSQIHLPEGMKKAVLLYEKFIRNSELPPFSPADYSGYWRYLTVRCSRMNGDIMLISSMHPQNLSPDAIADIKKSLIEHFSSEEAKECSIKSLYFELILKRRAGEDSVKPEHLLGSTHITDSILGQVFRISPEAFFQINTLGADILYQKAIEMCAPKDNSTVIDICCGTGTIGLSFAKYCGRVLGLELVEEAVKDAKANAELNNVKNCEFFTGKAEDILPSVLARVTEDDVIAIVDPPRAGLHMRAITQLRNSKKVKRLVYISCNPAAAAKNFVDLSRQSSKTLTGAPFIPIKAVPVDMFPHTKHVELIILFERESKVNTSNEVAVPETNKPDMENNTTENST